MFELREASRLVEVIVIVVVVDQLPLSNLVIIVVNIHVLSDWLTRFLNSIGRGDWHKLQLLNIQDGRMATVIDYQVRFKTKGRTNDVLGVNRLYYLLLIKHFEANFKHLGRCLHENLKHFDF